MNKILEELEKYSITKLGFFPYENPLELPDTFKQWKQLRLEITSLLINESLVDFVDTKLKVLECDSTNLPDEYLRTASVYISHIAHAYAYEIRRKTFNPKADITFPDSIEIPWQAITLRLDRDHPQISFYEMFNWNVYGDGEYQRTLFNVFTSNTADKFTRSFATVEKTLGSCAPHIYAINKKLNDNTLTFDELHDHLYCLIDPLLESTKWMRTMMNTSRFDTKAYVNPALWAKSIASIGQSVRKNEIGMSGGAAPSFRMFDIFLGRQKYDSELGKQLRQKIYLPKHTEFMVFIQQSAFKVIDFIGSDERCLKLFHQLSQLYYGEWGYLGMHQKKVYGFMLVGLSAGRTDTNGGTLKTDQNTAVKELDLEFGKARDERAMFVKSSTYPLRLKVKKTVSFGKDAKQITFDVKNKLFKIWPGDKLAIWPRNQSIEVLTLEDNVDIKLLMKTLNVKWKCFLEQHGLEVNTYQDLVKIILTYGIQALSSNHVETFLERFNISRLLLGDERNVSVFIRILRRQHVGYSNKFLNWLTEAIEPMQPRYYSICSSPKELSNEGDLSLTVGLLKYGQIEGKCSSFLHGLKEGDCVEAMPVYAYWTIPINKKTPIIMIAGGTGLSPMMSILKYRIDIGCFENYLFFVTKNQENFYFQNDLVKFVNLRQLRLFGSFTRDSMLCDLIKKSNMNIVELLNESRKLINELILRDASFFVCGRIDFAKKVNNTLETLLEDSYEKKKIPQMLINMKHQGKYVEEAFTSYTTSEMEANNRGICITETLSNDNYFVMNENVYDVADFKKVHPGGDFVFLVSSEKDYAQVHGKDPIARNMLDSLKRGKVVNLDKFNKEDLDDIRKLKNLIGKYYCATDIPSSDRTASMLVEHQSSFVKNFQSFFCASNLEALRTISNHAQFNQSADLIKMLVTHMPQDFIAFLWEKVEIFNFKFLFSLRQYLISLVRSDKFVQFDIYQNPYEEFTKQIFGFKRVAPSHLRLSINSLQNKAFSRLNSQLSQISESKDSAFRGVTEDASPPSLATVETQTNINKQNEYTTQTDGMHMLRKLKLKLNKI